MGAFQNANVKNSLELSQIIKKVGMVSKRLELLLKNIALYLKEQTYELIGEDLIKFQFKNFKEISQKYFKMKSQCLFLDNKIAIHPQQKQADVYTKQITILLHLIFLLRNSSKQLKLNEDSYHHYGFIILSFLVKKTKNNIFLQKLVAAILLSPLEQNIFSQKIIPAQDEIILQHLFNFSKEDLHPTILNQLLDIIIIQSQQLQKSILTLYYKYLLKGDKYKVIFYILDKLDYKILMCQSSQIQYFQSKQRSNFYLYRAEILNSNEKDRHKKFTEALKLICQCTFGPYILNNIFTNTSIIDFLSYMAYQEVNNDVNDHLIQIEVYYFFLLQKILVLLNKVTLQKIAFQLIQVISKRQKLNFYFIYERCFALTIFIIFQYNLPNFNQLYEFLPNLIPHQSNLLLNYIKLRQIYSLQYINKIINKQSSIQPYLTIVSTDHIYAQLMINCLKGGQFDNFFNKFNTQNLSFVKQLQNKMIGQVYEDEKLRQVNRVIIKNILHKVTIFFNTFTNGSIHFSVLLLTYHLQNNYFLSEIILSNLLTLFGGFQAIFFKNMAQKFIKTQDVIKFIKEKAIVQNKKIHNRQTINYDLNLAVFSDFSYEEIQNQTLERLILLNLKHYEEKSSKTYFNEKNLHQYIKIFNKITKYLDYFAEDQLKLQADIILFLQSLVNIILQTNNLQLVSIAKRLQKRLINIPSKLQLCLKRIQQKFNQNSFQIQKKTQLQQKKKNKMNIIKQKQKLMLQSYKIQQQKSIKVECIVCKNTKEGYPFLLGHFRYNNFFQNGVLIVGDRPFLQFSTCGHYIHEQCLQQSHKNQFRIWYPCILCKSICNVLIPSNQDNQQQIQIQRSICFLKNLAAIYYFFYKDRQNLLEFNLQTFIKIFPLLFKSLTYLITVYPLLNVQYFQRSQYPIARFIYKMLALTYQKVIKIEMFNQDVVKGQPLFGQLYNYISQRLKSLICKTQFIFDEQSNKSISKQTFLFADQIIEALNQNIVEASFKNIDKIDKIYRQIAVSKIIRPQNDLFILQNDVRFCKSCGSKHLHQQICLLCGCNYCRNCLDVRKVHSKQIHLGQAIFLRTDNGKYVYIHDDLTGQFQSLYIDFLGEQLKHDKKVQINQYRLNNQSWQTVINDLLANRIHREIMKVN